MTQAAKFWDKRAAKYAQDPIRDMAAYEHGLDRVRAHLRPGMRVLEIGCGTGMTALTLADGVDHYLGTDVSAGMVEQGNLRLAQDPRSNVTFRAATTDDLVAAGETFDAVLAFNLLHLLPNVNSDLANIQKLLKADGLFISKTVCRPSGFDPKFSALMGLARVIQLFNKGLFVRIETVADFDARISAAGFDPLEVGCFPKDPPSRFIVAQKKGA